MMSSDKVGPSGEKGVALLLVVSVVSLLTVIILQFNKNMRFNLEEAWSFKDREQLNTIAESGIDLAIAVLHTDSYDNDYDSMHDSWGKIGEDPLTIFDRGAALNITISDLSGRFQLNSLVLSGVEGGAQDSNTNLAPDQAKELFLRLLLSGEFSVEDDLQANEIVDSIVDWLDSDDKESTYGAEDGYYESLDPPYSPRNNLLELPNELLAIKGITSELLYGNDEKKALADYITVFGDNGTININTADPLLIQAIDDRVESEKAALLVEFREDEDNAALLGEQSWYRSVSGWPGDIELSNRFVVTTSNFFKITAEATLGNGVLTMVAYIKRSDRQKMEILYRKVN
jgi:general secretion pathway protein K